MLTTIEKIFLLQDIDLFARTSTDHLASLAAVAEEKILKEGQTLFQAGDPADTLYALVDGRMRLDDGAAPQEVQKSVLDVWSCLARKPHRYTASSLGNCRLLCISAEELLEVLGSEPDLAVALLQQLASEKT